jgi:hypothetical protein
MTHHHLNAPPRRSTIWLLAIVFAVIGIYMLMHGAGLVSAAWLNPNPYLPPWVFAVIGVIMLFASWLMLGQTHVLPRKTLNAAGYGILSLSLLMMHWLVFFSEGGSCSAETGGMALNLPALFCRGIMGLAVIVLDLILIAVLFATLRTHPRT